MTPIVTSAVSQTSVVSAKTAASDFSGECDDRFDTGDDLSWAVLDIHFHLYYHRFCFIDIRLPVWGPPQSSSPDLGDFVIVRVLWNHDRCHGACFSSTSHGNWRIERGGARVSFEASQLHGHLGC